jgi:hypothetical protein
MMGGTPDQREGIQAFREKHHSLVSRIRRLSSPRQLEI